MSLPIQDLPGFHLAGDGLVEPDAEGSLGGGAGAAAGSPVPSVFCAMDPGCSGAHIAVLQPRPPVPTRLPRPPMGAHLCPC